MKQDQNTSLMKSIKNFFYISIITITINSCNNSDKIEKLPAGYEVFYEGGGQNRLLKNNMLVIDSGLVECKYKNDFLLVSVDTTFSMVPKKVDKRILKYFIQNLKKDSSLKKISYKDLQRIIMIKSLEDINITEP